MNYREAGATWRPLWITLAVLRVGQDRLPLDTIDAQHLLLVPTRDPESLRRALLARLDQ